MTRHDLMNALALLLAIGCSLASVVRRNASPTVTPFAAVTSVIDADGRMHAVRPYARIVSLSILADQWLVELVEPERLIAASRWSHGTWAWKLGTRPRLDRIDDLEPLLALRPDLVVINGSASGPAAERLRAHGCTLFALGDLGGWERSAVLARDLATLCAVPERAEALLRPAEARLAALRALPRLARRAMYVGTYGERWFGGTTGTSYHDVLDAAGLEDAAAERFTGWPTLDPETVLSLAPDLIITGSGSSLRTWTALRAEIVELPEDLLGDPGLGMIDAAERLRAHLQPTK